MPTLPAPACWRGSWCTGWVSPNRGRTGSSARCMRGCRSGATGSHRSCSAIGCGSRAPTCPAWSPGCASTPRRTTASCSSRTCTSRPPPGSRRQRGSSRPSCTPRPMTHRPSTVTGLGVELDTAVSGTDVAAYRAGVPGLGERPYLVYVGRVDPGKGSVELFDFFAAYKRRNPSDLALVVVGDPVEPMPPHPDIFITGFVAEPTKRAAMGGGLALVQPSYFESFSLVLIEAWALSKAALVQGRCDVLEGHARRSGGGIPYRGFAEFEAAVDLLVGDPGLAAALGRQGRRYVERHFDWDRIIERYEDFLDRIGAPAPAVSP